MYEATLSLADRVRVVPGHPESSELVRRVRGQAQPRMPFDGPPYLPDDDIKLIVVDGLTLGVSGSTRIDKSPAPGDYVEVRGRVATDGSIIADRIRTR